MLKTDHDFKRNLFTELWDELPIALQPICIAQSSVLAVLLRTLGSHTHISVVAIFLVGEAAIYYFMIYSLIHDLLTIHDLMLQNRNMDWSEDGQLRLVLILI